MNKWIERFTEIANIDEETGYQDVFWGKDTDGLHFQVNGVSFSVGWEDFSEERLNHYLNIIASSEKKSEPFYVEAFKELSFGGLVRCQTSSAYKDTYGLRVWSRFGSCHVNVIVYEDTGYYADSGYEYEGRIYTQQAVLAIVNAVFAKQDDNGCDTCRGRPEFMERNDFVED